MLQRAASNAYSWWWASHIRTKQSKWMQQSLQDMEEKVAYTLKLIEEDGDSFARRAEMYYKKRPELINFVEESFRAYRALAERYDHLSTELQNANNTIAAVFPEQVQFAMDEDDEAASPRILKKPSEIQKANIPNVPKAPVQDLKSVITSATKKLRPSKSKKATITVAKSGLSKPEGLDEIGQLQKKILALQTEKEFVKSSYESKLAKYWEIENQIKEVQERVCSLQDEFGEGMVIEDEEARTLMAAAALRSCQETLAQLQEKQGRSAEEAKVEHKRIKGTREKLESLKDEFLGNKTIQKKPSAKEDSMKLVEGLERFGQDVGSATQDREELESSQQKINEQLEVGSSASFTVTEMAEKIDELVYKVVSLETAFSSQTSLIQRLSIETDELQTQIRTLEGEKATLINSKNDLSNNLMEMEEKLHRLQGLNCNVEDRNNNLQTLVTEAHNPDHFSDKLQSLNPDEELQYSSQKEEKFRVQFKKEIDGEECELNPSDGLNRLQSVKLPEELEVETSSEKGKASQTEEESTAQVKSRKEIDEQVVAMNPNDGLQRIQTLKLPEELEVTTSSEKEKTSPAKVQFQEEFEGSECAPNLANDKQYCEKRDEMLKVSGSIQKEDEPVVKSRSLEEFKEQEEKLNHSDAPEKARDVQTEFAKNKKERDLSTMPGNQGEAFSQSQENVEPNNLLEKSGEQTTQAKVDNQALSQAPDNFVNVERQEQPAEQGDEPDWKQMFLKGMEDREKVLLTEYTTVLRNYKDLKKKLNEEGMKTGENICEKTVQLEELRRANAKKDEEIRFLYQKLSIFQAGTDEKNNLDAQCSEEGEDDIQLIPVDQSQTTSAIEEKIRMDIDELLEENLDFWLRFSASFHQIQKFDTEVKDLQAEVSNVQEKKKKHEGSSSIKYSLKSDVRALYNHLREIQTELTIWMEKSALLKEEMKSRFSSLCNIQEEITGALRMSAEGDDFKFTSYQAAKFQGEVLNMKQENNKVADELQAGLDHVTGLQIDVEKTLTLMSEEFELSEPKSDSNIKLEHSDSKSRVPLRSFIFGVKPKKQRSSFLSCMHPALAKKYNGLRSGMNR